VGYSPATAPAAEAPRVEANKPEAATKADDHAAL
jgi:hypothetical protein